MKKRVMMGFILLAMVAASAAFAQQPTLDKLSFTGAEMSNDFIALPANDRISGAVVIPATYNGKKVFAVMNFMDCRSITSVTIPASVTDIYARAFQNCASLTSVTFQGTATNNIYASGADASFPGDLATKYKAGGAGTYTRSAGGTVWTKQGAAATGGTGNGTFTLTGIPSAHNGKYAAAAFKAREDSVMGAQSINVNTAIMKLPRVSNGSVTIPLWFVNNSGSLVRYSGSDAVTVSIGLYNSENVSLADSDRLVVAGGQFASVRFSNGSAAKSWNEGSIAAATTSLDGVWEMDGFRITISGNSGVFTVFPPSRSRGPILQSAIDKGYFTVGNQYWRNIASSGNSSWSGQFLNIMFNTSSPNVATGTRWDNCTFTMSADGKTITTSNGETWTRR